MLTYKKVKKEIDFLEEKLCDKCGRKIIAKNISDADSWEWQEFYHIKFTGGYGSVFGDDFIIECDFCQHCLKELIGPYYRSHDRLRD